MNNLELEISVNNALSRHFQDIEAVIVHPLDDDSFNLYVEIREVLSNKVLLRFFAKDKTQILATLRMNSHILKKIA